MVLDSEGLVMLMLLLDVGSFANAVQGRACNGVLNSVVKFGTVLFRLKSRKQSEREDCRDPASL